MMIDGKGCLLIALGAAIALFLIYCMIAQVAEWVP